MIKFIALVIILLTTFLVASSQGVNTARKICDGEQPAFGPDGKTIVVSHGNELYLLDSKGRFLRNIVTMQSVVEPSWSPDGIGLAFASYGTRDSKSNQLAIWIVNVDGTNLHRLVEPALPYGDQYPSWSSDGRHITWTHGHSIWIADRTGKNAHPLTNSADVNTSGFYECHATWSPDSKTIAYLRSTNYREPYEVWIINLATQAEHKLDCVQAYFLRWSKDPMFIFTSDGSTVYKVKIDSLVTEPCYGFQHMEVPVRWFSLSLDERHIAYDTSAPETDAEVMIDTFTFRTD